MKNNPWRAISVGYLALSILLGGASAAGFIGNALLQVLAICLIAVLLWRRRFYRPDGSGWLIAATALYMASFILSLVPLPPAVWENLPLRSAIKQGFQLLGIQDVWVPLSLAPSSTIASALWLLPPIAMFLLTMQLSAEDRRILGTTIVTMAVLSLVLGAFQLLGGGSSPLLFYQITSPNVPVGFFANVNHQATFLLCALPMVGASVGQVATKGDSASKRRGSLIMGAAIAIFLALGIALTRSMAGYGLFLLSCLASILIYRRAAFGPLTRRSTITMAVLSLLFVVGSLVGPLSRESLSSEFNEDPASRGSIAKTTLQAIEDSFPAGTGLGTFGDVYRRYENADRPVPDFTNHAHNDYLEFILELGIAGVLVALAFILWWLRRSVQAWRDDYKGATLARAGSVAIGVVLVHSLVDYPIRTSAIASIFAVSCALLLQPRTGKQAASKEVRPTNKLRHLEAS